MFVANNNVDETSRIPVEPVSFYVDKLEDMEFVWSGPVSNEYSIPTNQALRALAFLGDVSVPSLLKIAEDSTDRSMRIEVYGALGEIGLPVYEYEKNIEGDVEGLEQWWQENKEVSLDARTIHRLRIGLPPPNLYDSNKKDAALPR